MRLFLSGEGPTDIGTCEWDEKSKSYQCKWGPIGRIACVFVKELAEVDVESVIVNKSNLFEKIGSLRTSPDKARKLPGKKSPKKGAYFFKHGQALGLMTLEKTGAAGDSIAILFRDSDPSNTADRLLWEEKHRSILDGFRSVDFDKGVPMLPKPTSEAWLLALFQEHESHCRALEDETDRDRLKSKLEEVLAQRGIPRDEFFSAGVYLDNLDFMPSFVRFKERLREVLSAR